MWVLAYRRLRQEPLRTLAVGACTALLAALALLLLALGASGAQGLRRLQDRLGADALVLPQGAQPQGLLLLGSPRPLYLEASLREALRDYPEVQAITAQLFVLSAPLACCFEGDTLLVGYEPETDFTITPWLREHLGRRPRAEEVIVGSAIQVGPGGRIRFYGTEFRVLGRLEPTGGFPDRAVFVPMKGIRAMIRDSAQKALRSLQVPQDKVSAFLLKLRPGSDPGLFALKLRRRWGQLRVVVAEEFLAGLREDLGRLLLLGAALLGLVGAGGAVLLAVVFVLSAHQGFASYGLMRLLGARRAQVKALVLREALLSSGCGALAGTVAGWFLFRSFVALLRLSLGQPLVPPPWWWLLGASVLLGAAVVLVAAVAALWAAHRAARAEPYALARGGPAYLSISSDTERGGAK